jgi:hypothetical protein
MGLGTSLILVAAGAILRYAVTSTTSGVNLHTVGLILMIVGAVGFAVSLLWMMAASGGRAGTVPRRREYPVDEPPY